MTAPAGFDQCFREHYPRLVVLGAAMCGSVEIARELAQETMARASARWDEVTQLDRPEAWLRRVMTNLLIDHHRSSGAEQRAYERLAGLAERSPGAERHARSWGEIVGERQPDLGEWAAMMAPLAPRQRSIVTLYYAEDLSVAEIAEALGISPGTVKSALGQARSRLFAELTKPTGSER